MSRGSGRVKQNDGWTVITRGPSGRKTLSSTARHTQDDGTDELKIQQRVEDLNKRLAKFTRSFRDSIYWDQLRKKLDTLDDGQFHLFDSYICLGLGSFDGDNIDRSLWQLVLFRSVASNFDDSHSLELQWFVQEPKATVLDRTFLKDIGIGLLEHPTGIEKITERTFLFDAFLPWNVMLADVLPGKTPRLYMGSSMNGIIDMCEDSSGLIISLKMASIEASEGACSTREEIQQGVQRAKVILERMSRLEMPTNFECHAHAFHGMLMLANKASSEPSEDCLPGSQAKNSASSQTGPP